MDTSQWRAVTAGDVEPGVLLICGEGEVVLTGTTPEPSGHILALLLTGDRRGQLIHIRDEVCLAYNGEFVVDVDPLIAIESSREANIWYRPAQLLVGEDEIFITSILHSDALFAVKVSGGLVSPRELSRTQYAIRQWGISLIEPNGTRVRFLEVEARVLD